MTSIVQLLSKKQLCKAPSFVQSNTQYETQMGSVAYGVSNDNSDIDVYGFCIPPKHIIYPHTAGVILDFDKNYERFEQYEQHHILDPDTCKEYDLSIYNIVKYFRLVADGNPNMIDSLFTPIRCVLSSSMIGQKVRESRKLFLSAKCYHTFKGYAYAQLSSIRTKKRENSPERRATIDKYGYDVKHAYHLVRLLNECEQILTEMDLDLERNNDQLKAIRNGDWTLPEVEEYFAMKEKQLEVLYGKTQLPYKPRDPEIKALLMECLKHHYSDIEDVKSDSAEKIAIAKIKEILGEL